MILNKAFKDMFAKDEKENDVSNLLPEGEYVLRVIDATLKRTKTGTGQYVLCKFVAILPAYPNKTVYSIFNTLNTSETAARIGRNNFQKMVRAIGFDGVESLNSTEDLINRVVGAYVKIKPATNEYPASNIIKYFFHNEKPIDATNAHSVQEAKDSADTPNTDEANQDLSWF